MNTRITSHHIHWISRLAIAFVYVYFGALKLFGVSPANGVVQDLLSATFPIISFDTFIIVLGVVEICIGALILIPGITRFAVLTMCVHLFTTFGPFVFLSALVWQQPFVFTLEGQYIAKNIVLVALGLELLLSISNKSAE